MLVAASPPFLSFPRKGGRDARRRRCAPANVGRGGAESMRIGGVIQARTSSRRLPGKVMRPLRGRPMIAWLFERLRHAAGLDGIVLATSTAPDDDALAAFAAAEGIPCHRGALEDVGGRLLKAAKAAGFDALVRVNGDSPLIDPALVAEGV